MYYIPMDVVHRFILRLVILKLRSSKDRRLTFNQRLFNMFVTHLIPFQASMFDVANILLFFNTNAFFDKVLLKILEINGLKMGIG